MKKKKKKKFSLTQVTTALGIIATIVGIYISLGLPTFKDFNKPQKPVNKPAVRIEYNFPEEGKMNSVEQRALIPTGDGTTEVYTNIPRGASKMIEINNNNEGDN